MDRLNDLGDHPSDPESCKVIPSVSPTTARRRLMIAASAVLPSVYTLSSGAQTAAASNVRCWSRADEAGPDDRFAERPDGWLRKAVFQGKHRENTVFCVMSDQSECLDPKIPNHAAPGSVWVFTDHLQDQRIVVGPGISVNQVNSGSNVSSHAYALLYVDQTGSFITLDPQSPHQLRPVRETCWDSIIGTRSSNLG